MKKLVILFIMLVCSFSSRGANLETNHVDTLFPELGDTAEIYHRKLLQGYASGQFTAAIRWVNPGVSVSTTAYAAGDVVGGVLTLTNVLSPTCFSSYLNSLMIIDRDNQKPNLSILLFNANPVNGAYSDNGPISLAGDDTNLVAQIDTDDFTWRTLNTKAALNATNLGRDVSGAGANLWAVIVTRGAATYTQTTNLVVKFGFVQ
jgi:hypothetical protein